jgi:hypothetical protein
LADLFESIQFFDGFSHLSDGLGALRVAANESLETIKQVFQLRSQEASVTCRYGTWFARRMVRTALYHQRCKIAGACSHDGNTNENKQG